MFSILRISVFAAYFAVALAIAPNSVQINLETSIRIEPDENIHHVLENITSFIDKIKYAILPTDKVEIKRRSSEIPKKYFTRFLYDVLIVISRLKNVMIEWFFKRLYEEIQYYFKFKGSAFAEIVKNPIVKRYLEDSLKTWSETEPYEIKTNIREYLIAKNKNKIISKLGNYIDEFYDKKDVKKFKDTINKLKNCRQEKDFAKVIRDAIHNLIIKHYDSLNYITRTRITEKFDKWSEFAIKRRFKADNVGNSTVNAANIHNISNITQTKVTVHKYLHENTRTTADDVVNDIESIKNKYVIKNNNNTALREDNINNIVENTTEETNIVKRFQLKPRTNDNINGTEGNTTVPQDINDSNITILNNITDTEVPLNISVNAKNETSNTTAPNMTTDNTTAVPEKLNITTVPENLNITTVPENNNTIVENLNNTTQNMEQSVMPVLQVKVQNTTDLIPVLREITIPGHILNINAASKPSDVPKDIPSGKPKEKITSKTVKVKTKRKIVIRRKKTTRYRSPSEILFHKHEAERKRLNMMDIEERLDVEGIDGK
ncbi:uncharacterized protein PFC0810c-like [Leguminivora glycinivorella]|uniref:uncharacterized protein PFC0810c-like n=1 Tax=Leguminivora glycinivorella TaxID=1035111 RepID=UPI00200EC229|nr:uncharacterized protein PFC0810c-like [Leguminivora glycinivorella]